MQHGDFTQLADSYSKYRPGYSPRVIDVFIALIGKEPKDIQGADVGAGTGIFSRALAERGMHITAVEPNDAMREHGQRQSGHLPIAWLNGSAEDTNLAANSCDFVTMASSFHWADFNKAITEFNRVLKPNGLFMALWNTRHYETNPLLVDIENKLHQLVPNIKRISSGRSEFCEWLVDRLEATCVFQDVIYVEGRHIEQQTPAHYLGLWESVNDVRVQAGEEIFKEFLEYIKKQTADLEYINAEYITRAWIARTK